MLETVRLQPQPFERYRSILDQDLYQEAVDLARRLEGRRILHINSTRTGGGVAVLLKSTIPLLMDLGLDVQWRVMDGHDSFYRITKTIHNGLQGGPSDLTEEEWQKYESFSREVAGGLDASDWDLIVVHDPQPCAVPGFMGWPRSTKWVWRCHIDLSQPRPSFRERFARLIEPYDARVYTLPRYSMLGGRAKDHTIPPGIDALSEKNLPMERDDARRRIAAFGLDPERPIATQVGRFDPWKDPLGVLRAWKRATRDVPGLQLALVGETAKDDPEGQEVLAQVRAEAESHENVHVIADTADDGDVNAFQTGSDVVLQKSIREGFGLTVSEASWSNTPVVGGRAGGIPMQIVEGKTGFLVETEKEASTRIRELVTQPERARDMGKAGHEHVRRHFLLPRMMRDDLRLWASLLGEAPSIPLGDPRRRKPSES